MGTRCVDMIDIIVPWIRCGDNAGTSSGGLHCAEDPVSLSSIASLVVWASEVTGTIVEINPIGRQ